MEVGNGVKVFLFLVAVMVVGLGVMKFAGSFSATGNAASVNALQVAPEKVAEVKAAEVKEFTVKAFRFGYEPSEIAVNKGDKVKISINNTDTLHGIRIPKFGVSGDDAVSFTASEKGEFAWYCNVMCGPGHKTMGGKIIVK